VRAIRRPSLAAVLGLVAAILLAGAPLCAQQWTGKARLEGKITNEKGEPVADAVVKLRSKGEGPDVKSGKTGRWAYLGLTGGPWDVDVSAPGYETFKTTVQLSEITRIPGMDIKLRTAAPAPAPVPEVPKSAAPDVIPILEKGNALLEAKDYSGARQQYERALEILPDNAAILRAIARAQYGEKKTGDAVATLKRVLDKEPGDSATALLLASLQLEQGQLEEGKATLARVPPDAIKDPGIYINMGVVLLNKKKPEDAWEEFDKAVKLKPDEADAYFYRGLAAYQAKKKAEAKADFQKYLELAPTGDQAGDAKELLKSIK
jgi:tetratricopeptide (TPR) repeat protein